MAPRSKALHDLLKISAQGLLGARIDNLITFKQVSWEGKPRKNIVTWAKIDFLRARLLGAFKD